ncbi:hypothetical protein ANO14919_001150 [Xylariales sp. No.14919]|nr:hypothetical protein ANO14919_001150 [Xylariales sp. No.14919]
MAREVVVADRPIPGAAVRPTPPTLDIGKMRNEIHNARRYQ